MNKGAFSRIGAKNVLPLQSETLSFMQKRIYCGSHSPFVSHCQYPL